MVGGRGRIGSGIVVVIVVVVSGAGEVTTYGQ